MKSTKLNELLLNQLDEQLAAWKIVKKQPTPKKGWIRLIRLTLGLSTGKLAARMGVHQTRVVKIESSEIDDSLTLKTLKRAANAMECQLVYGVVPNDTLHSILEKQAKKISQQKLCRVACSMQLENQKIGTKKNKTQFSTLVKELLAGSPKKLWEDK